MIEMTERNTAVVKERSGEIATAIRGPSMKRKKSSKLAEDRLKAIEVMTEVTQEVLPEAVN